MRKKKKIGIIVVAVVLVILVLFAVVGKGTKMNTEVAAERVSQGTVETNITATGVVQPVYKVDVGTQVSGIVKNIYVDFNSAVRKGDLLAELDKSTLLEQVKQSQASLNSANSNKQLAQKSFDRVKTLLENHAATQEEYDQAETQLQQANNQWLTASSNYENARTNLKYAEIYSPIDGVILNKAVEEGQTVASSFSTPTLFTIANDLTQMQVKADVDEADIGRVRVGQQVKFSVDAFPNDSFTGTVKQIRLEPTVTSNVVTYKVIIDAPNPESKLYPGMTANVSIIVDQQQGLVFPVEALYFDPDPSAFMMLKKAGYKVETLDKGDKRPSLWTVKGRVLRQVVVQKGIDDGANAVAVSGLSEGDSVVLSVQSVLVGKKKEDSESLLHIHGAA